MYGERSSRVIRLFGTNVHTNLEAVAIILATGFLGSTPLHAALVIASFATGTGLHLASHWVVAIAYGKGIENMVLTRAGRIDYAGAPPGFVEEILRTGAGATMNALLAVASFGALATLDLESGSFVHLAVRTFGECNLILTAINFLPAIPLDGGLILRAVLARFVGEARATNAAAVISIGLLTSMGLLGILWRQPVLVYLGAVIVYDNWRKYVSDTPREAP